MGLKETLKQSILDAEPQSKAEDLKLIQDLTERLEETKQRIQTLQLENSTLQLENQTMKSAVMTANEQIESLTNRAASVNETELKNKELLRNAKEAKALSDKSLQESKKARQRAISEANRAESARQQAEQEEKERYKAQEKARKSEGEKESIKTVYKSLFIGNGALTLVLALLMTYSKRNVLTEVLNWVPDRLDNIKSIALWFKGIYPGAVTLMIEHWKLSAVGCYLIASIVFLALLVGLFFLCRWLFEQIGYKKRAIKAQYIDGLFKGVISADIAISLFFICLWFYEPIKSILPFNIFSVWLMLSIIGCAAWNGREIIGGVQRGY